MTNFKILKFFKFSILFFILIFSFFDFFVTFANISDNSGVINDLKLEISNTKIGIGEDFLLTTSLDLGEQTDITEVQISGVDKFNHIGNSNSMRLQSINGITKGICDIEMRFQAREKGNFVIGPINVKIGDKIHSSNTVSLEVGNIPTVGVNTGNSNTQVQSGANSITDINDNIGQKKFNFNSFFWFFVFGGFLFLFYFLLRYYFSLSENKKKEDLQEETIEISNKNYFLEKLEKIKNDKEILKKGEFLNKINDLIREILEFLGVQNATKKTFKELERSSKINKTILEILKETYFEQFKDKELELDKDGVLEKLKKIINKDLY